MMKTNSGTLYGIGVGPGDPDLIPLKSVKVLSMVDIVFAASSTKNSYSLAISIAAPHIPASTPVQVLSFPMTRDPLKKQAAWKDHAQTVITALEQGKNAAFLTLGDPMTYSTYGYVLKNIQAAAPHLAVLTIPGITAYQAAAACLNTPLVEGEESLLITSGVEGGNRLRQLGGKPENVVFMKAYRNVADIACALEETNLFKSCVGVKNCSHPDEEIIRDITQILSDQPDYWTLIIAKQNIRNGASEG